MLVGVSVGLGRLMESDLASLDGIAVDGCVLVKDVYLCFICSSGGVPLGQHRLFEPQVPSSRGSLGRDSLLKLLLSFGHGLEFQPERGEVKCVGSAAGSSSIRRQVRRVYGAAMAGERVDLVELQVLHHRVPS